MKIEGVELELNEDDLKALNDGEKVKYTIPEESEYVILKGDC